MGLRLVFWDENFWQGVIKNTGLGALISKVRGETIIPNAIPFWGSCTPMSQNGTIWERDLALSPGQHQYLFTINGWDQVGNAPIESECYFNPCDDFANYGLVIPSGSDPIELDTVCWQACSDCSTLNSDNIYLEKEPELIKIIDLLGREVPAKAGEILIYIYDDRSAEKKMIWPTQ